MKILVTGHTGFIGSNSVAALKKKHNVVVADVVDSPKEILEKMEGCFAVLHLGAVSSTMNSNVNEVMSSNFELTKLIVDESLNTGTRVIYASSASVYGTDNKPSNLYGWSKYCGEQYGLAKSPKFIALRYFNVYGPGESHKGSMASIACQAMSSGSFRLFEGKPKRDFVYIKDVVSANLFAIDSVSWGGVYDVGSGESRTFEDVLDILKVPYSYRSDSPPSGYQYDTKSNPNKWMLGWKPKYNLEAGLRDYMEYMKNARMES